jgi:nucleotide-binding universal stress UspA family protein
MKTIITLTDFSSISFNAVNYAADMANAIKADLSVLHVCQIPMSFSELPYPADDTAILFKEDEEKISQLKEDLVQKNGGKIKINTEVRYGTVVTEMENYCAGLKPYAVVMGTQGSSEVERALFGSNTIYAMKHLSWPLIIVPPEAKYKNIKTIGLACDLKKVSNTTPIEEIKSLMKEFNAELHVLHVNREDEKIYRVETLEESHSLQKMLEEFHPVYHFLNNSNIEEGLGKFAEKNNLDMLMIVPKRHNIFDKLLHKSHSKKLVLRTHVPIMAIHE